MTKPLTPSEMGKRGQLLMKERMTEEEYKALKSKAGKAKKKKRVIHLKNKQTFDKI
jgi:hypothetical protein